MFDITEKVFVAYFISLFELFRSILSWRSYGRQCTTTSSLGSGCGVGMTLGGVGMTLGGMLSETVGWDVVYLADNCIFCALTVLPSL